MPVYTFKCEDCGEFFDEINTMSKRDEPINNPCPKCSKSGKIRRAFDTVNMSVDWNHRIDRPHNVNGFAERIEQVANSPSLKGTAYGKRLLDKHTPR